jgi:lipopolysaccharide export LptBFGC system permease protein LptF
VKTLDRYILRIYLATYGVVLLFTVALFLVFEIYGSLDHLLENRENLAEKGRSVMGVLLQNSVAFIPFLFLQAAPILTVLAATIAFIRLMRGNEITPMVAAGRSPLRVAAPVFAAGLGVTLLMLAMQEWIVPEVAEFRDRNERLATGRGEGVIDDLGIVVDGAGNRWRIERYHPNQRMIEEVSVFELKDSGTLLGDLTVPRAVWRPDGPDGPGWYPSGGVLRPVGFAAPRPLDPEVRLDTDLDPEGLDLRAARFGGDKGRRLSLTQAHDFAVRYPELHRQTVAFHNLITWPLGNLLLLVIALPILLRFRERNFLMGVGVAIGLCAAYFVLDTIFQDLGNRAVLPPVLASWLPTVLFASAGVAVLDSSR